MLLFDSADRVENFKALSAKVREHNVPIILQLAHGGGQCLSEASGETVAPSSLPYKMFKKPRELSEPEIDEIINCFVRAITRAKKAEFSGVEVHAAHGYLLSAFLSPHFNLLRDQWGVSTENRFRVVREIVTRARQQVGNYPILLKIRSHDELRNGTTIDESLKVSKMAQEAGYDAIEVSCGNNQFFNAIRVTRIPTQAILAWVPPYSRMPTVQKRLLAAIVPMVEKNFKPVRKYNVEAAGRIKEQLRIPVIAVGGIRSLKDIEEIVDENKADYASMCRPFITEPDIVSKFLSGKQTESRCIDCGYCAVAMGSPDNYLRCYRGKIPAKGNSGNFESVTGGS